MSAQMLPGRGDENAFMEGGSEKRAPQRAGLLCGLGVGTRQQGESVRSLAYHAEVKKVVQRFLES